MKRLILGNPSGLDLKRAGLGDAVLPLSFRFAWGVLPSPQELAAYFGVRAGQKPGNHWSDWISPSAKRATWKDLAFSDYCQSFDIIELWFDPDPNDQLQLIWVLDQFHAQPDMLAKLKLRLVGFSLLTMDPAWRGWNEVPLANIRPVDIETASMCWQAYRATTPQTCFDVVHRDLSAFPLLRPALLDLLRELPWSRSGLGATEMRLLELIAAGFMGTNVLFYLRGFRQRGVFNDMEIGRLLEGLAHGPRPAIAGLDDGLRSIEPENARARLEAFQRSRLSVTAFGKAVLAHEADFTDHNPINRWWGGTHLTNDSLWRWNPALTGHST
ncbi:hypothetical protein [Bradyrhizobium erythrophlei]|uniref:Uncharacterized protein n=1 Tax=Bradyrhizobium erythrophlei TaxID=1437360 RepID=A0A1H4T1L2_9BRAD|nr:hypothetical protein [Bradyrhizobium erythrophlei]SEC50307.1 hypothetical protein SAMN05444164_1998 [Bradyrhizobium erythrophlei]